MVVIAVHENLVRNPGVLDTEMSWYLVSQVAVGRVMVIAVEEIMSRQASVRVQTQVRNVCVCVCECVCVCVCVCE